MKATEKEKTIGFVVSLTAKFNFFFPSSIVVTESARCERNQGEKNTSLLSCTKIGTLEETDICLLCFLTIIVTCANCFKTLFAHFVFVTIRHFLENLRAATNTNSGILDVKRFEIKCS